MKTAIRNINTEILEHNLQESWQSLKKSNVCNFEATFLLFWNKILPDMSHLSPRETFLRQSIHIYQWIWLLKNCSYLAKQRTLLLLLMLHYISLDGASCSTKKITHNCGNKRCYMYNKSLSAAASACNSRCRNAI